MKLNTRPVLSFSLALLLAVPSVAQRAAVAAVVATETTDLSVRLPAAASISRVPQEMLPRIAAPTTTPMPTGTPTSTRTRT